MTTDEKKKRSKLVIRASKLKALAAEGKLLDGSEDLVLLANVNAKMKCEVKSKKTKCEWK